MSGPKTAAGFRFALLCEELIIQERAYQNLVTQLRPLTEIERTKMEAHQVFYHWTQDGIFQLLEKELGP